MEKSKSLDTLELGIFFLALQEALKSIALGSLPQGFPSSPKPPALITQSKHRSPANTRNRLFPCLCGLPALWMSTVSSFHTPCAKHRARVPHSEQVQISPGHSLLRLVPLQRSTAHFRAWHASLTFNSIFEACEVSRVQDRSGTRQIYHLPQLLRIAGGKILSPAERLSNSPRPPSPAVWARCQQIGAGSRTLGFPPSPRSGVGSLELSARKYSCPPAPPASP